VEGNEEEGEEEENEEGKRRRRGIERGRGGRGE